MTRDEIYALCKAIAPKYNYEPLMVLAQVQQESSFNEHDPRLEQNYLRKYILTDPVLGKTTAAVKAHMASSFGFGQLMGHSLYQLGYFPNPDSVTVAIKLDEYEGSPDQQIETMCQWLAKKQKMGDSHTLDDALRRYNGSADYPPLVYARYKILKGIYEPDLAETR